MPNIAHNYSPDTVVWAILVCDNALTIKKGTVVTVTGIVNNIETKVQYEIKLTEPAQTKNVYAYEADVFNVKADAIAEYGLRVAD